MTGAAAKDCSAHRICMFLLRPESEYSGGLNSSLVHEPITFNSVGGLIAVFAGAWISITGAPPNLRGVRRTGGQPPGLSSIASTRSG